ncbi:probable nucleoporin Nup54 [Scaptodrosophila lebanonensis]|uniref:Probable nucleoporin Nup54 n=1 Tax=Drosophila lebanonensis TaxID=7225 RepID=A0A6J2UGN5_DROLE|nr:probable nucleoporin Nup54 [Scaptodrosophila lebanonensis]
MSSTRDKTSEYETSMRTKRELFFGDLEEAGTSSSSTSVEAASRIFGPSPTLGNPVAPKVGARFAENIPTMLAQPNMQMPALNDEKIAHAISNVTIYGDERDNIVTKWNYLQALWGVGKLFYSSCAPPVEIIQANPDNMGLVALNFNERLAVIAQRQQELVQTLYILIGNKPQYTVSVDTMRELENEGCQMIIYVEMTDGKRLLSTTLAHFLTQTTLEAHLRNLGIVKVFELTQPDETQVKNYLESGQNKLRGHKRILTPKINFHDLKRRLQFLKREHEDQAHQVDNFSSDLENVQAKLDEVVTKLLNQKGDSIGVARTEDAGSPN